jgi:hypothetical protein
MIFIRNDAKAEHRFLVFDPLYAQIERKSSIASKNESRTREVTR